MVVGSVAFDNVITPYGSQEGILGGAASYCSFAASYFTQPRMVGVIGNDFGDEYLDRLRKRGIDLEGVQKDESGPTFFWKGKYHENFNRRDTLDIQLNVSRNSARIYLQIIWIPNSFCSVTFIRPCRCMFLINCLEILLYLLIRSTLD